MTAMPAPRHVPTTPDHLLTIAEYAALSETEPGYTELVEGRLLMAPSPTPRHNIAVLELAIRLGEQMPPNVVVIQDIDIDLQLVPPTGPGFSRRPDLIVVDRSEVDRVDVEGGIPRASAVHIVVEIVSPGSRRTDNIEKRCEYAEAGIPWYWIIDITEPVSIVACQFTEEFGYQDDQRTTGIFTTEAPFPVALDLTRLR
jgi:Uma2 family endonuclease